MVSARFSTSSVCFLRSFQSKLRLKSVEGSMPALILGAMGLKNFFPPLSHSCHLDDEAFISSLENFSKNSSWLLTEKRSMSTVFVCFSFLLISFNTFSTSEDLPHRLGEMIIVLMPFTRLLYSFAASASLLVKEWVLTVLPYIKGESFIILYFVPTGIIPGGIIPNGIKYILSCYCHSKFDQAGN